MTRLHRSASSLLTKGDHTCDRAKPVPRCVLDSASPEPMA